MLEKETGLRENEIMGHGEVTGYLVSETLPGPASFRLADPIRIIGHSSTSQRLIRG